MNNEEQQSTDDPHATRWSLVARVQDEDSLTRRQAMETLLQTYLPVLRWYLTRHSGLDHHQREDLIQGFTAAKLIEQNILTRADPARGRFRSFLLDCFQNYIRDELRKAAAARRMPESGPPLPLEEADAVHSHDDMERHFHEAWLRQVIVETITSMRKECTAQGRDDVWSVFESRLLGPLLGGEEPEAYESLVQRLGLASPSQASNLLVTAKRSFARHLESIIAETVSDPSQIENELAEPKKFMR